MTVAPSTDAPSATPLTGVWATEDGQVRIDLREDGTFVEDFNGQEGAYDGQYTVEGSTLTLNTSSGIMVEGTIAGDSIQIDSYELRRTS